MPKTDFVIGENINSVAFLKKNGVNNQRQNKSYDHILHVYLSSINAQRNIQNDRES